MAIINRENLTSKIGNASVSRIQLFLIVFFVSLFTMLGIYSYNDSLPVSIYSLVLQLESLSLFVSAFYLGLLRNLIYIAETSEELKKTNMIAAGLYLLMLFAGSNVLGYYLYQELLPLESIFTSSFLVIVFSLILSIFVNAVAAVLTLESVTYVTKMLLGFKGEEGLAFLILSISVIFGGTIVIILT